MSSGYQLDDGRFLEVVTGVTATNSAPSGATAGIEIPRTLSLANIYVTATAGTTPGCTVKAWVYLAGALDTWVPLGKDASGLGDNTVAGIINDGVAMVPYASNSFEHVETLDRLSSFRRFYAEFTAITGTATPTFSVYLLPANEA